MTFWILIRSTGISAYLLLSLSIFIGTLYSLREQIKPVFKIPDLRIIHIYLSTMALGATFLHGGMLLFHREKERLSLQEILVPFTSRYDSFWIGIATIALYFMVLLAITGVMQRKFSIVTWRKIHAASYVAFVLALLHSIAVGTDTWNTWIVVLYATTGFLVGIVYLYRVVMLGRTRKSLAKPEPINHA
ncbi:MAG TPA: hypothetical protein DDY49_01760 [Paenibacillaceae bacterium]|nr:hypothetical protein [Paenibacillaceae bacterium]